MNRNLNRNLNSMMNAAEDGHAESFASAAVEGLDPGRMTAQAAFSRKSGFSMGFGRLMTAGARMAHRLAGLVPGLRKKESRNSFGQTVPEEILDAVRHGEMPLQDVPEQFRTPEVCWIAVQKDGMALRYVPGECITEKMCLEAVRNNGAALIAVPPAFRSQDIMTAAVRQYPPVAALVPESMREKVRHEAVRQDERAWKDAVRILETAARQDWSAKLQQGRALLVSLWNGICPAAMEPLLPQEKCLEAVKQDWNAILHVREEDRTPELCMAAVQQEPLAMLYVPDSVKTPEFCDWAVQRNGLALQGVPEKMQDADLCWKAIKQNGTALFYVSDRLKTLGMCLAGVSDNGFTLAAVPDQFKTTEICVRALRGRIGFEPNAVAQVLAHVPARVKEDPAFKAELERVESGFALDLLSAKMNAFRQQWLPSASAEYVDWLQGAAHAKVVQSRSAQERTPSAC